MVYEYWLASVKKLSGRKKILLRRHFGSAKKIFYMAEKGLQGTGFLSEGDIAQLSEAQGRKDIDKDFKMLAEKDIRFIPFFSEEYPPRLLNIASYPYALYVKGNLPDKTKKSAAIVGARNCSAYGEKYALAYGKCLAENDVQIISGMARGIDAAGQRGALNGHGETFAVLGCGVDICYPKENIGLAKDILESGGGILSEFVPGTNPLSQNFPMRNRIISGLSDVVLVMEARVKSGSLITADMALEQGKDVYALPGCANSLLSRGCNNLIYQGAGILLSPETLLEDMGIPVSKEYGNFIKTGKNEKTLESGEKLLYSRLALYPKNINRLIEETGIKAKEAMDILISLELKGYIKELSKNYYIRV